jgi:hypothetical protein
MARTKAFTAGLAVTLALAAGAARADEIFLGGFTHDVTLHVSENGREQGQDIDVGYRTEKLDLLKAIGRPQFYGELFANDARRTSFAALGLTWRQDWLHDRLYGQFGFGGAYEDQRPTYLDPYAPGLTLAQRDERYVTEQSFKALGSRILFHPSFALGWRLTPHLAAEATWAHFSNAGLLGRVNPGLDDVGARLVWRFGGRR